MRTALLIAAVLTTAAVPFGSAQAKSPFALAKGKDGPKGFKGKGKSKKSKKSKKGKKGKGDSGGSGGSGDSGGSGGDAGAPDTCELPNGVESMVKGAGQRLSFTFAGKVWLRDGNTSGSFFLAFHPQSPGSAVVHVTCRYNDFTDFEASAEQTRFTMSGSCREIYDDGRIESVAATNEVLITNAETDSVSISSVGGGLSVPAGTLSFGNFQMANASDPPPAT